MRSHLIHPNILFMFSMSQKVNPHRRINMKNMVAFFSSFLLLCLFLTNAIATGPSTFWSIDCGGSTPFTDKNGIQWSTDTGFVRSSSGEVHTIRNSTVSLDPELRTLRSFPSNTTSKSCYTIPVPKGTKIFLRVKFFYGNYDGRVSPPEFRLQFDGNVWTPVSASLDEMDSYEMVYVVKRNGTSVCWGRKKDGGVPFVSSIEVRTLKEDMYGGVNSSFALFRTRSVAFGSDQHLRYPFDAYDRSWGPTRSFIEGDDFSLLRRNTTTNINTNLAPDNPPLKLFDAAATTIGNARNITIKTMAYLFSYPYPVYINMYFSELMSLDASVLNHTSRSFHVYMDNEMISDASLPIVPPIGGVLELSNSKKNASSDAILSLVATQNSTLPPIISGMEVLCISGVLDDGTNESDVVALSMLQRRFQVLEKWTGDPCLPFKYNWEWAGCSSTGSSPRITQLLLGGYGLSGLFPDISALDALEVIDLHRNSLSGDIPEFLGHLPNLRMLNLADNDFATIPSSLKNNKRISLDVSGNPKLCASGPYCGNSDQLADSPRVKKSSSPSMRDGTRVTVSLFLYMFILLVVWGW